MRVSQLSKSARRPSSHPPGWGAPLEAISLPVSISASPAETTTILRVRGALSDRVWTKRSPFDNPRSLANLIGYDLFEGQISRTNAPSYREVPQTLEYNRGKYLFRTRCDACHALGDGRNRLGPDLLGLTDRRDRRWLSR
ncbi:MAG TPA: c-type cytochrome [Myxococcales bacterium]|nr:c-type cytochrome [Myxococcales bacterium]